jgi:zinc protease
MRNLALTAALALSALSAPPAVAQTPAAQTPAAPKLTVEQWSLPNGLTVLLAPDARLPVVAVEVRYLVGSGHEVEGRSGFAHLFEHLMFQGSEHHDSEYFAPFEPIGADVNGTTNVDRTNYYEQVPSQYLELALWMEADRLRGLLPVMTQAKLDNQRDVVKNERRQRYEVTPYGEAWLHLAENVFPKGHPYNHTTIGSHEDLTAASLDDVKGFFRQYYVPANAVLTLSGDFEVAQAKRWVEQYFGDLPSGQRAPKPTAAPVRLEKTVEIVKTDDVKLPRVYLAWPSPAIYAPGDSALDVFATLLTDGKSSFLFQPLVYEKKVAKDVAAFQSSQLLSGYFVVMATAAPGQTREALAAALFDALKAALAAPPSQPALDRSLAGWRKSFYGNVEGAMSRAQMLSGYYHFTGTPNGLEADLARYTALKPEDIHRAAREHLSLDKYIRIDIVPEGAAPAGAQP